MAKIVDGETAAGSRPLEAEARIAPSARTVADSTPTSIPAAAKAAPKAAAPDGAKPEVAKPAGSPVRRLVFTAVAVIAIGGGLYYGINWWTTGRFMISTDDAYVSADTSTVTSKVAGYVRSVPVKDNVRVKAGDPLVILDDADYRNAVAQAQTQIATGQATVDRLVQQIAAAEAAVTAAKAQLVSAQAAATNAKAEYDRVNTLAANSFASTSSLDTARTAMQQAAAAADAASAAITSAQANVAVAGASKIEAERALDQYGVGLTQAKLNLDHTVIRAPFDGMTGNGAAQPGEYVAPGQRLMAVVPLDNVYIDANFKETQVGDLAPGQKVKVTIDAYPDTVIEGTVASVSPASGSVFSLLPPENATGNFTKIVQRVTVRILLPRDVTERGLIRPGMSVVASVDSRSGPGKVATLSN
jgi:membrane fusion protein (multidrug efflux system)